MSDNSDNSDNNISIDDVKNIELTPSPKAKITKSGKQKRVPTEKQKEASRANALKAQAARKSKLELKKKTVDAVDDFESNALQDLLKSINTPSVKEKSPPRQQQIIQPVDQSFKLFETYFNGIKNELSELKQLQANSSNRIEKLYTMKKTKLKSSQQIPQTEKVTSADNDEFYKAISAKIIGKK